LVNITGGASLSISEFEEVGEVIKNLTADDATVIVGTVIDNQMDDELRVTIVATGLEQNYANFNSSIGVNSANINTSTSTANLNQNLNQTEHPQQHRSKFNQTIYNNLNYLNNSDNQTHIESNMDYLDIPAFLRRQSE